MKIINVVGAAIVKEGKILCTKRDDNRILGQLWEFPGGKIEKDETPQNALIREIKEELGAIIKVNEQVVETKPYEYEFGIVNLTVFYAEFIEENFEKIAHSDFKWMNPSELSTLTWAPADINAVKEIERTLK